ncbi:MAG: tRNA-dihydrouridine synthase family protein [Oscillospiraceae bacterium]|nr:tRNA-dihydrouridine synthase family protein [Oscillospiraceae bacterium]
MEYLFAPMEGITSVIFRRIHHQLFPGPVTYYSPFIAPDSEGTFKTSYLKDLMPDRNEGIDLVPQILANNARAFIIVARKLKELGYEEVNLNAGCPSGTVFSKHKGAGMLSDLMSFGQFLDAVYAATDLKISIKTRMGVSSTAEFEDLAELYSRYPIHSLTIHARDRLGMYKSLPDLEMYRKYASSFPFPVFYNGNIFSPDDVQRASNELSGSAGLMIGRGAVANPALFRVLAGGAELSADELRNFHDTFLHTLLSDGLFENFAINRMKELWYYMICCYPEAAKEYKALNKSRKLADYQIAVNALFRTRFVCSYFSHEQQLH